MMGREHIKNVALIPEPRPVIVAIFEPDVGMRSAALELLKNGTKNGTKNDAIEDEDDDVNMKDPDSASAEASLEAVLSRQDLDALIICSPNFFHAEQLQAIFSRARGKALAVLVEKPACTRLEDVASLRRFASSHPAPLWVAMEYRWMPAIAEFVKLATSATGGVTMLTLKEHRYAFLRKVGHWNRFNRNTGGTLVEKACHFFDLMRLVMRDDPIRVFASGGQNHNHADEFYSDGGTPDIIDNAYVILEFPHNRRACLELCMFAEGSRYQEELTAIGPKGKIECKVPGPTRFWPDHLGDPPVASLVISPRHPAGPVEVAIPVDKDLLEAGDHNGSTFYQHCHFARAVAAAVANEAARVEVSLYDGLKAVLIGLAAEASAASGVAIDFAHSQYSLSF